jgi:hypothetical protein
MPEFRSQEFKNGAMRNYLFLTPHSPLPTSLKTPRSAERLFFSNFYARSPVGCS